ncbi:MAG: hypothetical protein ACXW30_02030 [Micavibrio sp.]
MTNRNILIAISVLILGIFGILAMNYTRESNDGIGDSVNEVVEEIGDEIDDNTTAR